MASPDPTNEDASAYTICLDFDGVLNKFQGWTGQYEDYDPLDGVEKFLLELTQRGWRIVVSTARPDITPVVSWLDKYGLRKYVSEVTNHKPIALAYVDDRAVYFDGNYQHTIKVIAEMTPWYHRKPNPIFRFLGNCWKFGASYLNMLSDLYLNYENEDFFEGRF